MTVHIKFNTERTKILEAEGCQLHLVPCKINADTQANVDLFFNDCIEKDEESDDLRNCFRGYPLHGKVYEVPSGYTGMVLQESNETLAEQTDRNFYMRENFKKFTCWNWDKMPSKNDALVQALDWLDIASVLHNPIQVNNSTNDCDS